VKRFVSILFGLLVLVAIVASGSPVSVYGNGTSLSVEDASTHLNTIQVAVGSNFVIEDWIRGIPSGDGMDDFGYHLNWNPALMQYVSHVTNAPFGWTMTVDTTNVNSGVLEVSAVGLSPYGADRKWLSVSFRCMAAGSSSITISDSSWLEDVNGFTLNFDPILDATVTQTTPLAVGGEMIPINQVQLVFPWLALITVLVILSVHVLVRRLRTRNS
jgi:hypothetical protein